MGGGVPEGFKLEGGGGAGITTPLEVASLQHSLNPFRFPQNVLVFTCLRPVIFYNLSV